MFIKQHSFCSILFFLCSSFALPFLSLSLSLSTISALNIHLVCSNLCNTPHLPYRLVQSFFIEAFLLPTLLSMQNPFSIWEMVLLHLYVNPLFFLIDVIFLHSIPFMRSACASESPSFHQFFFLPPLMPNFFFLLYTLCPSFTEAIVTFFNFFSFSSFSFKVKS